MSLVGFQAQNHPQQTAKPHIDDRAITGSDFAPLRIRFGFTLDAAASALNARLPRYCSADPEDPARIGDGLRWPWKRERVWCNPPYSAIEPWVAKAWDSWDYFPRAELIVMLLPANRTEQGWWQRHLEPELRIRRPDFRVEFLPGRLRFLKAGQAEIGPNERPPFGCCLAIWGGAT